MSSDSRLNIVLLALMGAVALVAFMLSDAGVGETDGGGPHERAAFRDAVATSGELPDQSSATIGTPIGDLLSGADRKPLTAHVGRRVHLAVDLEQVAQGVTFWSGDSADRLLVAIERDVRSGLERQQGRPSNHPFASVDARGPAMVSGVIEPLPYPEAMFSWGLTGRGAALLHERAAYVRVDGIVPAAPEDRTLPDTEPVQAQGRDTAPPS